MSSEYNPIIIELPELKNSILSHPLDPDLSIDINYPKASLGFNYPTHEDRSLLKNKIADDKNIHLVLNTYNIDINDYEEDIKHMTKKYVKENAIDDSFYELWELLFLFELININGSNFVHVHIGSAGFIQASQLFRQKFVSKPTLTKNDAYYIIDLKNSHMYQINKAYTTYINKPKENVSLITANAGINWDSVYTQEQDAYGLFIETMITMADIQSKGGTFICKLYETYTEVSIKLLCILREMYEIVYIVCLAVGMHQDMGKYVVCLNYSYKKSKALSNMRSLINPELQVNSIFPTFDIPQNFIDKVILANNRISEFQIILINKMIKFINDQNYYGDVYHKERNKQIEATKKWLSIFFPSDYFKSRKILNSILDGVIKAK